MFSFEEERTAPVLQPGEIMMHDDTPGCPPALFVRQVTGDKQTRRTRRKERSASSLSGMFGDENRSSTHSHTSQEDVVVEEDDDLMEMESETEAPTSSSPSPHAPHPSFERQVTFEESPQQELPQQQQQQLKYSREDREQLVGIYRKLRQTKRRLFLKSVSMEAIAPPPSSSSSPCLVEERSLPMINNGKLRINLEDRCPRHWHHRHHHRCCH
jgi:hypothetical protein